MRRGQQGQVTAEMAVLYTFVIAGLVFMGVYLQRGVQGSAKSNADGIGTQFSTEGGWKSFSAQDSHEEAGKTKTGSCSQFAHAVDTTGAPPAPAVPGLSDPHCANIDGAAIPDTLPNP